MKWRLMTAVGVSALLAGCGGSGGGSSGASVPAPVNTPNSAASTQQIAAGSAGSVSATLNGETVTATVPAGALSVSAPVTLTVYQQAVLPRTFAARARRTQSVPAGAQYLVGMSVALGAGTLLKPLAFRVTGAPSAPASDVIRLAGAGTDGFGDVDTATEANGTITEALNPAYTGVTLANAKVVYAFYAVPPASAAPPPALTVALTGPPAVDGGTQASYSASEANLYGFPALGSAFTFSLDSAALGTITPTGTFTASAANNVQGHVVATDRSKNAGTFAIAVLAARPATAGDSVTYGGTLTTTIANNAIGSSPVTSTQTGSVTQTVSVASSANGQAVLNATESDNLQLSTLTTKTQSTIAYQQTGNLTDVRMLASTATDSNNAVYQTAYTPTSGLLTVEPEQAGSFGPNTAAENYTETDPGVNGSGATPYTTKRVVAADGSYNETTNNADGTQNVAQEDADGTGSYVIGQIGQNQINSTSQLGFYKIAGSPPTIPVIWDYLGSFIDYKIPVWYPQPLVLYAETDTVAPSSGYDPRCSVPSTFGTTAAQVTQALKSIDTVYGDLEQQTSIAYDVDGIGTVCSIFTNTTDEFYDYSGQSDGLPFAFGTAKTPLLTTTTTEVLSIGQASVAGSLSKMTNRRVPWAFTHAAVFLGRERFLHAVRLEKINHAARMAIALRRMEGAH